MHALRSTTDQHVLVAKEVPALTINVSTFRSTMNIATVEGDRDGSLTVVKAVPSNGLTVKLVLSNGCFYQKIILPRMLTLLLEKG